MKLDKATQRHIINVLRRGTVTWRGRSNCLKKSSRKTWEGKRNKAGEKIFKTYWQCNSCKEWGRDQKDFEVDHRVEVGPFDGDIHDYALRMYQESNLQTLCIPCHTRKTSGFNATLKYKRKKP